MEELFRFYAIRAPTQLDAQTIPLDTDSPQHRKMNTTDSTGRRRQSTAYLEGEAATLAGFLKTDGAAVKSVTEWLSKEHPAQTFDGDFRTEVGSSFGTAFDQ